MPRKTPSSLTALTVSPNGHFWQADGTPFFWLADTWWYVLTDRVTLPQLRDLAAQRKKQGFTVALMVVGIPPEIPLDDPAAHAQGESPFLPDGSLNPQYCTAVTPKILAVLEAGLVPCLVGGWGPQIQTLGKNSMLALWQAMVAHFSHLPVVWCLTGEVDLLLGIGASALSVGTTSWKKSLISLLPSSVVSQLRSGKHQLHRVRQKLAGTRREDQARAQQVSLWLEVGEWLAHHDPHHRPILVHPHTPRLASAIMPTARWLAADTIQSGHTAEHAAFLVSAAQKASRTQLFLNLEPWYEGIMGQFGAQDQRYAFWMSVLSGAAGHTYGADGLWNFRTNDHFLSHWGRTTWPAARRLPGAEQLGRAAQWWREHPWWEQKPEPDFFTPAWEEQHPYRPVASRVGEQVMAYVPAQYRETLTLRQSSAWDITILDPATMKPILQKTLDAARVPTAWYSSGNDSLLIFSPRRT